MGSLPLLPYYFKEAAALLPAGSNFTVSFYGGPSTLYVTDAWSARIAEASMAGVRLTGGIFVIGDSQPLGYALDFHETFPSIVAGGLVGNRDAARILAAPSNHPATYQSMLNRYGADPLPRQRLVIASLNLGNDLDEMFMEGWYWARENSTPFNRWMALHSFVFNDLRLIRANWLVPGNSPAGVNPVCFMMAPDERVVLAREAVTCLSES